MAETPKSNSNNLTTPLKPRVPPSRRRDKPQLSCNLCRRGKLKCDRAQPCSACSRRGFACVYPSSQPTESFSGVNSHTTTDNTRSSLQDRVNQLEKLVESAFGGNQSASINTTRQQQRTASSQPDHSAQVQLTNQAHELTSSSPSRQLPDSFGRISLQGTETSYVGSTHWLAILNAISELKEHFQETVDHPDQDPIHSGSEANGPELLFGGRQVATKQEILAFVPSRAIVDRLLFEYFNTMDQTPVILHGPTFLNEYEQFWRTPDTTPVMWIGLLFAMMCLAIQFRRFCGEENPNPEQYSPFPDETRDACTVYREMVIQCLILGEYARSGPYTIETLLLYFATEHLRSKDTQFGNWLLMGTIVRIAMRQAYHRDPSHSSQITPFQGEMRRRTWSTIVALDLTSSAQNGLPRMIKEGQCNTSEPRNLMDADIHADLKQLPESRPLTDPTPMQYSIVKNRLLSTFGTILDHVTSVCSTTYSETMRLDQHLRAAYSTIPESLQFTPSASLVTGNPLQLIHRIYLSLLYHKAQCVLHRQFLAAAHTDSNYTESRRRCLEAALQMLQHQSTLHAETQPGGRLYRDRWKVSSLLNHDFLLAVTIVCLDIDHEFAQAKIGGGSAGPYSRPEVVLALQKSYPIWLENSSSSREAANAAEALKIVLRKTAVPSKSMLTDESMSPDYSMTVVAPLLWGINQKAGVSQASMYGNKFASVPPPNTMYSDNTTMAAFSNMNQAQPELETMFDWDSWDAQFRSCGPSFLAPV